MAMRKTTFEITPSEAAELSRVLGESESRIAQEMASAVSDLADGRISLLSLGSEQPGGAEPSSAIEVEGMSIDLLARTVTVLGCPVQLTPKEFEILAFLAQNRGVVFTKEQIYRAVWKDEYLLDDSNIMAFIRKIRKKVEPEPDSPRYLLTVWGVWYKFAD